MKITTVLALLLSAPLMAGCTGASSTTSEYQMSMDTTAIADVAPEAWEALTSRRIFFGHQSVGRNILAGMRRVLDENPHIGLTLASADDPRSVAGPAFIEANIGRNGEPATKADAFETVLDAGFGEDAGAIAMYKYCYVDVTASTNPDELFADYAARVDEIRARFPGLTIVHITLPLKTAQGGLKEQVKTMLGRNTQTGLNRIRERYNQLLRERYAATDPVFDLALLESTRADGTIATSRYLGEQVPMLAPEWTNDGGHLNEAAEDRVAERLLVFLARVASESRSRDAERVASN